MNYYIIMNKPQKFHIFNPRITLAKGSSFILCVVGGGE